MHRDRKQLWGTCLLLIAVTAAVYWPSLSHPFSVYDDPQYVTDNQHVQTGLTASNVAWAFTTAHASNWHPLTWISHILDAQLWGTNPIGHHLTSVLLHSINAALLFLVLFTMTGNKWHSVFVACLFAWHPLRVESVSWIAERKDVLSSFFFFLTLLAYTQYAQRGQRTYYLLSLLCFVLGLLSKPMLVTLPCLLLLLDYWPLERDAWRKLVLEKTPFFALAIASILVTLAVQQKGGAVSSLDNLPFDLRLANAVVSYPRYIGKIFWPHDLSVLYPHPGSWPWSNVLFAALLLICLSALVVLRRKSQPWLFTGWFWFLGTLVPVIGLVQAGVQSMADRYTYIPSVGLFIALTWGVADWIQKETNRRNILYPAAAMLILCIGLTWRQERYWRNDETLFRHAETVAAKQFPEQPSSNNPLNPALSSGLADIQFYLAVALSRNGKPEEAVQHYAEVSRLKPAYPGAHENLGIELMKLKRPQEAADQFRREIELHPRQLSALNNLGTILMQQGNPSGALTNFLKASKLNPTNATILFNIGNALVSQHRFKEAQDYYALALKNDPHLSDARNMLMAIGKTNANPATPNLEDEGKGSAPP